jgi:uridine nucleosidase
MYQALMAMPPNTVWLVAIGPLTNIAQLVTKYPVVQDHLRGLSIMGGVIGDDFCLGSATATAPTECWNPLIEFNILCDPEAARLVLSKSPRVASKTTLIPLDLTHRLCITPSVLDMVKEGPRGTTTLRLAFYQFLRFYHDSFAKVTGLEIGAPLHDPIAFAVVLANLEDPAHELRFDVPPSERWHVEVSIDEAEAGRLSISRSDSGIIIPKDLDVAKFWSVFDECLHRADDVTE